MRNRALALLMVVGAAALLAPVSSRADEDRERIIPPEERPAMETVIRELFELQGESSAYPLPQLDDDPMEKLLKGELVRIRSKWTLASGVDGEGEEEPRERHRVMAFNLFEHPLDVVWIAAMDPHLLSNDRLSEARLETSGATSMWYQLIDPPWPARNRHWVIDVSRPVEVFQGTGEKAWELMWHLTKDGERIAMEVTAAGRVKGVPLARAKKSRYLEENLGAWTLFELDDNLTLAAYQVTIVMGGWIPDRLTARFALGALEDLMKSVEKNTGKVHSHYDAEHEPIWGGGGVPVPPLAYEDGGDAETASTD